MRMAKVVIVGRPNVGKSSFFNRVVGYKSAVVADREGVTRDRHYEIAEWSGIYFQMIDTGGFIHKELDTIDEQVRLQIDAALADADIALFLTDGRAGVTDLDLQFARVLQRKKVPSFLVVNKAESKHVAAEVSAFWTLGLGEPWPVSALHGDGIADLLDAVVEKLPHKPVEIPPDPAIRVAILGRPNAGKSTLVNHLVGENRVIISEIAGTTRDAIDTEFMYGEHKIILTDTAGLRRKARVNDDVEYYSNLRAIEAIRRSHVCVLLIDASRGMEIQDFRILAQIQTAGKGLIICLNKWDLVPAEDKTFDHMVKELVYKVPDLEFYPMFPMSGLTGKRTPRLLEEIIKVKSNLTRIIGRDKVIKYFEETVGYHPHPSTSAGPVVLNRACQVMVNPPAIAFETRKPTMVNEGYIRYLRRQAFEIFDLKGVPLRIWFRSRFQLRTDEELQQFLTRTGDASWTEEEWEKTFADDEGHAEIGEDSLGEGE